MSYTQNNRGSEWRKWDLHIHTPKSIHQNYKDTPEGWEKFICALENLPSDVAVIGITDYYFIDGYEEVMKWKMKGRLKSIQKIFPILEFRTDTFGSGNENKLQKLNLHILFDVDEANLAIEIQKIKDEFIGQICLSPSEKHTTKKLSSENLALYGGNLQSGFESFVPSTKDVFACLNSHTWKGKTFLFLGYKEFSNLEKNNQLKPIKEELYDKVNAFLGNNFSNHSANQGWLNEFGNKKLLHSLDIHGYQDLDTFELDQDGKVLPSIRYHCNTWIKADPTFEGLKQIIYESDERVRIQENIPEDKSSYQVIDKILIQNTLINNECIVLNHGLNCIIGGRSTGKSILLAALAKRLKTDKVVKFVDNPQYDEFVEGISASMSVIWRDGKEENDREIEYFEQGYMYSLARNEDKLSSLIQDILRQKGKEDVLDNYHKWVSENKKQISSLINDLFQIIADLHDREQTAREKGDKGGIESEIRRLTADSVKFNGNIVDETDKLTYDGLKDKLDNLNMRKIKLYGDIDTLSNLINLKPFRDNISYELTSLSEHKRSEIDKRYSELVNEFETEWELHLKDQIFLSLLEVISLDEEAISILNNDIFQKISKAVLASDQLQEYADKIKFQKDKLFQINLLDDEILKLSDQRVKLILDIKKAHALYILNAQQLLPQLSDQVDDLKIIAVDKFKEQSYKDFMSSALDQRSTENNKHLSGANSLIKDLTIEQEIFEIFDNVLLDKLSFKGGYSSQTFVNRLLSENFYKINYDLEYEGDDFVKMSDGKKAFVVLKLLLDFSSKSCPIMIDQPEDDLDNRAIYSDLVMYLRKKKKLRQIIVATHNPNIVVGSDSEMVIVANQHGIKNLNSSNSKFQYVSGSLEKTFNNNSIHEILMSKGIREHVCEILEGGDVAFNKRDTQYGISK